MVLLCYLSVKTQCLCGFEVVTVKCYIKKFFGTLIPFRGVVDDMDKERIKNHINAILQNCKEHMSDTVNDWEKAFAAFGNLLKKNNNDAWVNAEIQKAIIQLEEYLREARRD